jgi:sortase A
MILDGVDNRTLRLGIGHIPGTALPGEPGNTGIAGHRDTFFRALGGIHNGDQITVETLGGEYQYVVYSVIVVDPNNLGVLEDTGQPTLTLVTCYPFNLVGPSSRRLIVRASLVR